MFRRGLSSTCSTFILSTIDGEVYVIAAQCLIPNWKYKLRLILGDLVLSVFIDGCSLYIFLWFLHDKVNIINPVPCAMAHLLLLLDKSDWKWQPQYLWKFLIFHLVLMGFFQIISDQNCNISYYKHFVFI